MRSAGLVAMLLVTGCENQDPVDRWIRDLRSDDDATRSYAAARLGEVRPDYVPCDKVPIGAGPLPLRDGELRIVNALNDALLVDELASESSHVTMGCALGQLRPPGMQPGLFHCVASNERAAYSCMEAIVDISTPEVLGEMLPLLLLTKERRGTISVASRVEFALEKTGIAILPAVRAVVEADDDLELSRAVIFDLLHHFEYDDPPLPGTDEILVIGLRSRFAEVRYQALWALESIGFESRRAEIAALIDDPNENVRTKAAAMLEGRVWSRIIDREVEP